MRFSATPVYRLVVEPHLAGAPSRLVVLYARIEAKEEEALFFDPATVRVALPGDVRGKVFDTPRAAVLLERTSLVPWDAGEKMVGNLNGSAIKVLKEEIQASLMNAGEFGAERTLAGYLVADTGVPLQSFDEVTLEVFATRVKDASPIRTAYKFVVQPAPQP